MPYVILHLLGLHRSGIDSSLGYSRREVRGATRLEHNSSDMEILINISLPNFIKIDCLSYPRPLPDCRGHLPPCYKSHLLALNTYPP